MTHPLLHFPILLSPATDPPGTDSASLLVGVLLAALLAAVVLWLLSRKGRDYFGPHLRQLPLTRLRSLLLGRFFIVCAVPFAGDALIGGGVPREKLIAAALLFGLLGPGVVLLRRYVPLRVVLAVPVVIALGLMVFLYRAENPALAGTENFRLDAIAVFFCMLFGVRLLLHHINTEGRLQLRAETELEFAHKLQQVLVPNLSFRNERLEVYGRSLPSDKVGGDLIDLVTADGRTLLYLLDVSGHGIPAGALMGSLKTGIRVAFPQPMPTLLDKLNAVLPAVKEPQMYATLGALAFETNKAEIEYALAGHLPILRCRGNGDVEQLRCEQLPLGLISGPSYDSRSGLCLPGDLFVLYSDGITEVANTKEEQFGIERLESEIRRLAAEPLDKIWEGVMAATEMHGAADDDRSLLLVRVLSSGTEA